MIRTLRAALAVLAIVAFVAACSGGPAAPSGVASLTEGDASPDASTGPAASVDPETAMLAFAACMRENGVDMPDPQPGGGGRFSIGINGDVDREALQAAQEACQGLMTGALGEPREMTTEQKDALIAHAACMREHGIDMPDPVFEGGGAMIARPIDGEAIDPGSAEYQAAEEACHDLLGELGRDGGPSIQVGPGGGGDSGGNVEVKP